MTGTAVTTFEERVRQKLHEVVADLIPPERYDQIVRDAIRQYEQVDLPKEVKRQLDERFRKEIAAELDKPEWRGVYDNGRMGASEAVHKLLVDAAPLMLAAMMGSVSQDLLMQFRNNLASATGRYI